LCCKTVPISDEQIAKPVGEYCKHCRPGHGACLIYENRPSVCRTFYCEYLVNDRFGEEFRPTTCGFVLRVERYEGRKILCIYPDDPDAWRKTPYHEQLRGYSQFIEVLVRVDARRRVAIRPDGELLIDDTR
jgi:hypothetical protein